jgi:DNA processing protein
MPSGPEHPPVELPADELSAWLHLLHTEGVGRESARRLLAALGTPQAVLDASLHERAACVDARTAAALGKPPAGHAQRLATTLAWREAAPHRRVMVLGDSDYPPLLLHSPDPPLLLYLAGDAALLGRPSIALVGSRKPSAQGLDHARAFGQGLSAAGWTVVSGLAAGVDGAAHDGALTSAALVRLRGQDAGSTVAVIGTGIDIAYPSVNRALAGRIAAQGLIVSEFCLGTPPLAANFPMRNRLIAGLSRGTVVIEAALRSGSLITARLAAEAGREVMALPGSVLAAQSAGCHALIRQGAALVTSVEQVLEELQALPAATQLTEAARPPPADASDPSDPVLAALGHDPLSLDALIQRCGWPAPRLSAHLLTLELADEVARLPGGLYQRRRTA